MRSAGTITPMSRRTGTLVNMCFRETCSELFYSRRLVRFVRCAQSCRRIVRDTVNSASRPLLHAVMTPAQTLRPSPPGQPLAERLEMGTVTSRRSPCAIPHYGSASVTLCSHLEWNHGRADPAGTASVDSQQQRTEGAGSPRKVHVPHAAM